MILNTKIFQESANKILIAAELDKTAANLEIVTKDKALYLNVTNKEYYVSVKYDIEIEDSFRAVVDASLFLSLISGISAETFELQIKDNYILVKAGKSSYKVALIYENDEVMTLPILQLVNKTVEMSIDKNILHSILNINSKEIAKAKKALVALDADSHIKEPFLELCAKEGVSVEFYATKTELGKSCGINVGAACAVILL